jgi:hypothetical protein
MAINPIKVWNGTAWEYTGPVVAAPPVKYQATAPTSPATGDVWVESDYDVASVDPSKLLTGGVYTNESTRSAAIPTPTTGMVTYVGDTGTESPASNIPQIQAYTGAAWQNMDGLTQVANVSFSGASTITLDNVFTSSYLNYRVMFEASPSTNTNRVIGWNFRTTVPATFNSALYQTLTDGAQPAGGTTRSGYFYGAFNQTQLNVIDNAYYTGEHCSFQVDVIRPMSATTSKAISGSFMGGTGTNLAMGAFNGVASTTTAMSGFILNCSSGTLTGTVRVYGYRNA